MRKLVLSSFLLVSSVFAVDYSTMTLDEMLSQRGTVDAANRDAFRTEMQNKMQSLTPEERADLRGSNSKGQGTQQRLKDGTGGGNMYKGSRGGGNGGGGGRR